MLSHEGHKPSGAKWRDFHAAGRAAHQGQRLIPLGAQGNDHPSAGGQLVHEGLGHLGPPRRNENGVVGRVGTPTQGPIAHEERHVGGRGRLEGRLGRLGEASDPLDREHLIGERRQQGCLVPRPGPDLEDALLPRQAQGLEVARLREGLGDRLAIADRQRGVLVGPVP